jgi:hypothetical protein
MFSSYDGGISIEPHLAAVVHEGTHVDQDEAAYKIYVEYGKRVEKLVNDAIAKKA